MPTGQANIGTISPDLTFNFVAGSGQEYYIADSSTINYVYAGWDPGITNDASFTWDIETTNDSQTIASNFYIHANTTLNFAVAGYESPSMFRKLKWKLRDISHYIQLLPIRLSQIWQERQRKLAEAKAQILLDDLFVLVPGQKFIVVPSLIHKDREYRIPLDGSMPQVWVNGKMDHRLCIQKSYKHSEHIPRTDLVITRALMAQGAEDDFLQIANRVRGSIFAGPDPVFIQDSDM